MSYSDLEQELKDWLGAYFTANTLSDRYQVSVMPETPAEFGQVAEKGLFWVAYNGSDFMPPQSTAQVSQMETVKVAVYMKARKLRGSGGIYLMQEHLKLALTGYRPANSRNRMYVSSYGDWNLEGNVMGPFLEFSFGTVNVQQLNDDPPAAGGPLQGVYIIPETSRIFSEEFANEFE